MNSCEMYLLLFIGVTTISAQDLGPLDPTQQNISAHIERGNCSCGGFATATPAADAPPVVAQATGLQLPCDAEGAKTCENLCMALAMAAKGKGPEVLCKRIMNADQLKLSAFYKVCNNPWTYVGMTAEKAICCEDGQVKLCASDETTPSTLDVDLSP